MASDVILADEARTETLDAVRGRDVPWVPLVVVGVIGFASGLSPLFHGFYPFSTWGVFALVMLALVGGLVLGGQSRLGRLPAAAVIALVALAGIALVSVSWADSADDALTGA